MLVANLNLEWTHQPYDFGFFFFLAYDLNEEEKKTSEAGEPKNSHYIVIIYAFKTWEMIFSH